MTDKIIQAVQNTRADSMDLRIERDTGNLELILMGRGAYALQNWKRLKEECEVAIRYIKNQSW